LRYLRLSERRLRNASQLQNVSRLRAKARSRDPPHSHGLKGG
jgi:hypothetical protein